MTAADRLGHLFIAGVCARIGCGASEEHATRHGIACVRRPLPPAPVDYRMLLKRYMDHVGNQEGISFIPKESDGFTTAEVAELKRIEKELD